MVDELAILRTRMLRELDAGPRKRVLAAERRASSEPRQGGYPSGTGLSMSDDGRLRG